LKLSGAKGNTSSSFRSNAELHSIQVFWIAYYLTSHLLIIPVLLVFSLEFQGSIETGFFCSPDWVTFLTLIKKQSSYKKGQIIWLESESIDYFPKWGEVNWSNCKCRNQITTTQKYLSQLQILKNTFCNCPNQTNRLFDQSRYWAQYKLLPKSTGDRLTEIQLIKIVFYQLIEIFIISWPNFFRVFTWSND
jgi:hypothetical protein